MLLIDDDSYDKYPFFIDLSTDVNGLINGGTIARPSQSREQLEKTRGEFATSLRRISEVSIIYNDPILVTDCSHLFIVCIVMEEGNKLG